MLRVPKSVDYGVLILLALFEEEGELLTAKEIAERCGVSHQQVAKILKKLQKHQLVDSKQGAYGGYSLADPQGKINLEQIHNAVEGPLAFAECTGISSDHQCRVDDQCRLKPHLQTLQHAIVALCRSLSIDKISSAKAPSQGFPLGVIL